MTQRTNPNNILSTPLYAQESSIDFTTRIAKVLAKKMQMPVYVGNSISFASAGLGGSVEEEMEGFKICIDTVVEHVNRIRRKEHNQEQRRT